MRRCELVEFGEDAAVVVEHEDTQNIEMAYTTGNVGTEVGDVAAGRDGHRWAGASIGMWYGTAALV